MFVCGGFFKSWRLLEEELLVYVCRSHFRWWWHFPFIIGGQVPEPERFFFLIYLSAAREDLCEYQVCFLTKVRIMLGRGCTTFLLLQSGNMKVGR